jgi:radical SAM superfamily enzyme with C-terminal helix-hairpin-helix motif
MSTGGTMVRIGRLAKKAVSIGMAAAFATMLALTLAPSRADAAACTLSILNCGCTISTPGSYTLSGANPMTSTGTCVDITASNVTLVGGPVLKGPGSTTATYGVHVEASANKVILESIEAEDFGQGFHIDGPNTSAIDLITTLNGKGTVVSGPNAFLIEAISEADTSSGSKSIPGRRTS